MVGTVHGSALGFAGGVGVTALAAKWPVFALLLLVVVVAVVSWWTTVPGAVLTAVQCWGLYASFVVGDAGRLVLDWPALAVLAVASTASFSGLARGRAAAPAGSRPV
ncbi:hypothetical protein [Saccharothrix hoggarensis]|uniref:Uncharacterized protein n=1 Tax=Saccharothrix hoggarensis TaxID=913853 RepID=A0ABW3QYV7_9PSEU